MTSTMPVARSLDQLIIRADDAGFRQLFLLFYDTFQLPVAWPVLPQPSYKTGGIFAGNVNIEILRIGPPQKETTAPPTGNARLYGLVFESPALAENLKLLSSYHITHSPIISYWQPQNEAASKRAVMWRNVVLGNMLENHPFTNLLLALKNVFPGNTSTGASSSQLLSGRSLVSRLMNKAFQQGIVYLVEYNRELVDLDAWHSANKETLNKRAGGPLGLLGIKEIVLGTTSSSESQKRWQYLLASTSTTPPTANLWPIGEGPVLRLVPSNQNALQTLILKVASLQKAREFLAENNLLGESSADQIAILPEKILGLDIRLQ